MSFIVILLVLFNSVPSRYSSLNPDVSSIREICPDVYNDTPGVSSVVSEEFHLSRDLNFNIHDVIFYHLKHTRRVTSQQINLYKCWRLYLLLIAGDIAPNPGPVKNPCGQCGKPVFKTHRKLTCVVCSYSWHIKCANVSPLEYNFSDYSSWLCPTCNNFHFSDSFFSDQPSYTCTELSIDEEKENIFEPLLNLRSKDPHKFLCAYININS